MYNTFEEIDIYSPEDVLNPIFLFLYNDLPKIYYQYFKKMNKPNKITSLTGLRIETKNNSFIETLITKYSSEELKTLQLNLNKPLKLKENNYFFTLFNIEEKDIVEFFTTYILNNKKEKLLIVIFVCHPLTTINEFITNIDKQFIIAKEHNCVISVLNLLND